MEISFSISTLTCFTVTHSGSSHHKQSLMETNCIRKIILKLCLLHLQQLVVFEEVVLDLHPKPPQPALSVAKPDYLEPWAARYNLIFTHGQTVLLCVI